MTTATGTKTPLGRVEVALVAGAAAAGLIAARLYPIWRDQLFVGCPALTIFGVPCVTCGGTRSIAALAQGDLLGALAWNPLAAVGGLVAAALVVGSVPVLAGAVAPPPLPARLRPAVGWTIGALLAVNWLYLLFWFRG